MIMHQLNGLNKKMTTIHKLVPHGLSCAFYKATKPGFAGLYNRLARFIDRGPYSHTELVFSNQLSGSSSYLDGGVRIKQIDYSNIDNWDFLPIPDPTGILEAAAWKWNIDHKDEKYDVWGNIRFATNFVKDSHNKWFCSEANLAALGIPEAYRYGPNGAASLLQLMFQTQLVIGKS